MGSNADPSCRWMKETPALESRRVRTQPRKVTVEPTGTFPASTCDTLTACIPGETTAEAACAHPVFEASSPVPVAEEKPRKGGGGSHAPHVPTDVASVLKTVARPRRALVTAGMPYANGPLHL